MATPVVIVYKSSFVTNNFDINGIENAAMQVEFSCYQ